MVENKTKCLLGRGSGHVFQGLGNRVSAGPLFLIACVLRHRNFAAVPLPTGEQATSVGPNPKDANIHRLASVQQPPVVVAVPLVRHVNPCAGIDQVEVHLCCIDATRINDCCAGGGIAKSGEPTMINHALAL